MRFWKRLCVFALLAAPLGAADKPFGVWWRGGADAAGLKQRAPWVRGVFVAVKWSELEPQQGKYDWARFDETFTAMPAPACTSSSWCG